MSDPPIIGCKLVLGIFRRDAALDRVALNLNDVLRRQVDLRVGKRLARRNQDLALYQIDVRHDLGDSVLHLNSWIHFDEVERPRLHVHQKLNRARILIAHRSPQFHRRFANGLAHHRIEIVRRRHLDDLLVPSLNRTVTLIQVHQPSLPITQNLHLDVLGLPHEFLDEDIRNPECRTRLATGLVKRCIELFRPFDHPHPPAAAPHRRLDDHRKSQRLSQLLRLRTRHDRFVAPGKHRNARRLCEPSRRHLVAKLIELLRSRPHECNARARTSPREVGILGKEAVAGMNGVHFLGPGQLDDCFDIQIAADRLARRADFVCLVCLQAMNREPVFVRVDRDRPDPQLVRRAKHTDRDLAAIGDHQLAKLGHQRSSSSSASTGFSSVPIGSIVARTRSPGLR